MMEHSLTHQFLLATPALAGTYFGETMIYLCRHDASGAMGLVVNRLARMNARALARSVGLQPPADALSVTVMEGGPVSPEQGFILHSDDQVFESSQSPAPGIVVSTSKDALTAAFSLNPPAHAAIYLGYAGWGPGQLDDELEANAWLTAPVSRTILFDCPYDRRRAAAGAALGIDLRLLATRIGHG